MTVLDTVKGTQQQPVKPTYLYPTNSIPVPDALLAPNYSNMQLSGVDPNFKQVVPIVNKYNINIQGLNGDMSTISNIYEDILPETNLARNRMTTLGERAVLHSYIRSILVKRGDGEEVSINNKTGNLLNLLSYMKIVELNPYHYSRITNNSYKTLADNFVMFKSCYPIRKSKNFNTVTCASDSIGANVRVYSMSVYDELANLLDDKEMRRVFSEPWREILLYGFIREEILKKKVCPHFPFMHAYYITDNECIDFDKIKGLKVDGVMNKDVERINNALRTSLFQENYQNAVYNTGTTINLDLDKVSYKPKSTLQLKFNDKSKWVKSRLLKDSKIKSDDGVEYDVNDRSTKCIVAVTESPDQNIIEWSTRTYIIDNGPIKKQFNTGFHSNLTWRSVLFQLFISFLVMYKYKIFIEEFSWEKNVFVKIFNDTGSIGFWRYRVNDVDFYVPNMRALIMIDSTFDQIVGGFSGSLGKGFKFKLKADCIETPNEISIEGIQYSIGSSKPVLDDFEKLFHQFFDVNIVTNAFTHYGGTKPDQEILNLIDELSKFNFKSFTNSDDIFSGLVEMLIINFSSFLHNKIGQTVAASNKQQLYAPGYNINECKKGDLVAIVKTTPADLYTWGMFIGKTNTRGMFKILTIDEATKRVRTETVNINEICRVYGTVEMSYKPDTKIGNMDELLETYNMYF